MISLIHRFVVTPLQRRAAHRAAASRLSNRLTLAQLHRAVHDAVRDCDPVHSQRVRYRIDQANTPADLWLLRGEVHQCIAKMHGERVASERINDLAVLFEGWVPDSQLARIQPGFRPSAK